jgi:hypothetical protein
MNSTKRRPHPTRTPSNRKLQQPPSHGPQTKGIELGLEKTIISGADLDLWLLVSVLSQDWIVRSFPQ